LSSAPQLLPHDGYYSAEGPKGGLMIAADAALGGVKVY